MNKELRKKYFSEIFLKSEHIVLLPTVCVIGMIDILIKNPRLHQTILANSDFPIAVVLIAEAGITITTKPGRTLIKALLSLLNNG